MRNIEHRKKSMHCILSPNLVGQALNYALLVFIVRTAQLGTKCSENTVTGWLRPLQNQMLKP